MSHLDNALGPPRVPTLHFSWDRKFCILQVVDLHSSVSEGTRRGIILSPCEGSDNLTYTLLAKVLDDKDGDLRKDQVRYMQALPYSPVQAGPSDIDGEGNYVLKVKSAEAYAFVVPSPL